MCTDIDLEQECEDALFELCDVRERYPAKCADELEQCLHLIRRINMKSPRRDVIEKLDEISITDDQKILFQNALIVNKDKYKNWKRTDNEFNKILTNIDDLIIVLEQIKNAESCPIDCMIKGK
ncbi:hypothetical protein PV327_000642 [Microctonus hyperodae]|uniref:Uncharacterized protein n=1 Tax=Microctonus hyperodae TaxID=165561 RepID=A0AA39G7R3_MICHY|nr:hypothetical protein PV327_000642 [Microctonus hyperodae]